MSLPTAQLKLILNQSEFDRSSNFHFLSTAAKVVAPSESFGGPDPTIPFRPSTHPNEELSVP